MKHKILQQLDEIEKGCGQEFDPDYCDGTIPCGFDCETSDAYKEIQLCPDCEEKEQTIIQTSLTLINDEIESWSPLVENSDNFKKYCHYGRKVANQRLNNLKQLKQELEDYKLMEKLE